MKSSFSQFFLACALLFTATGLHAEVIDTLKIDDSATKGIWNYSEKVSVKVGEKNTYRNISFPLTPASILFSKEKITAYSSLKAMIDILPLCQNQVQELSNKEARDRQFRIKALRTFRPQVGPSSYTVECEIFE